MEQAQEALQDDNFAEETQEIETQEVVDENETEEGEIEEFEPEFVEIDYEGNKYTVPPELKDAVLRQADYTIKTQEVAEQRRALEAQQQQFQQAAEMQQRNLQGYAQLAALQSQLQQYDGVDWNQAIADNPTEANQAFIQYTQLKDATSNLSNQLQQQEQQALQQQQVMLAKQMEQGRAELARDIPGWNTDLAKSITDHGKTYGFTDGELGQVVDPRMVKVLHDAMQYRKSLSKATEAKPAQAKPAAKVKGKAAVNKDPDKMSTDEWLAWRTNKLKAK